MRSVYSLITLGMLFLALGAQAQTSVGAAVPLSGPIAIMGQAVQNGMVLYNEQAAREKQGAPLKYIFEDSRYDGKTALTILNKFASVDKPKLAMVWGNTPSAAVASVAAQLNLPTVLISHETYSTKYSNAVELGPTSSSCLGVLQERVAQVGEERFGSIGIDVGNVVQFLDDLDSAVGKKLPREIVGADASQFQVQLLKGKAKGITTYVVVLMPEQALILARQAKELKLDISIIGGDIFADDEFLKKLSAVQPRTSLMYSPVQPWFAKAYRERFKNTKYLLEASSGYVYGQVAANFGQSSPGSSLQQVVQKMDLPSLAYNNAQLSEKGVRISSPCALMTAEEYLAQ